MKLSHVSRRAPLIAAFLFAAVTACGDNGTEPQNGGGGGGGGGGETPTVTDMVDIGDNFFDPTFNQVSPGDTVTWTWTGSNGHNVTFDDASIADSPNQFQTDGTYSTAMPMTAGDYDYTCTNHAGMDGTVRVQ